MYGRTEPNRYDESAINMLIEKVRKTNEKFVVDHVQARFPTHCLDVARFLMRLVEKHFEKREEVSGILHCSALKKYTKYEMCVKMAELYKLSQEHLVPDMSALQQDPNKPQLRPMNAQLDVAYSFKLLDYEPIVDFEASLKDCLENFVEV